MNKLNMLAALNILSTIGMELVILITATVINTPLGFIFLGLMITRRATEKMHNDEVLKAEEAYRNDMMKILTETLGSANKDKLAITDKSTENVTLQ